MENNQKFLTVYAVLDEETQEKISKLQNKILNTGLTGTQTMGIPFHISLGSYPINYKTELMERIKQVSLDNREFEISLSKINSFGNKVLFVEPKVNKNLLELQKQFDYNFHDSEFTWHAHTTIFMGNDTDVENARKILLSEFVPMKSKITKIEMGEFFPAKIIISCEFKKKCKML